MNNKKKKTIRRIFLFLLFIVSFSTALNVSAATGYMYSSEGKLIECSTGFTVTEEDIFNVQSDAWKNGFGTDKTNSATDFNSPSDLCLYKNPETNEETIYIVDKQSNKLFIFNGSLQYTDTKSKFEIDPSKFTEEELSKIKTGIKSDATITSSYLWNNNNAKRWETIKNVEFSKRTEEQRFYIECNELLGVNRALRPLRDANNTIILDENGETMYQDIIFLCDSKNAQVLLLDSNTFEVVQVVSAPEGVDFASKFQPSKIVSDVTGKMYIVSIGIYEGILLMNYNGDFMRMVGVNYTTLSFWDALKRSSKTDEQLAQETTILQTTFNNIAIDSKGFLYAVSGAVKNADGTYTTDAMVKRINQSNSDVLKRNGYTKPVGDIIYVKTGTSSGSSNFISITINDYGVYTVVDSKANRLFTYDNEGNLLYISGGKSEQVTDIAEPTAITYQGSNILVLDRGYRCVKRFVPTDFANSINEAVRYEFIGDSASAADQWQNVINANPAYELAYVGVGKKLFDEGRYTEAMLNFQKGSDVKYFSRAYKIYRDDKIEEYFPYGAGLLLALIGFRIVWKIVKRAKNKDSKIEEGEL